MRPTGRQRLSSGLALLLCTSLLPGIAWGQSPTSPFSPTILDELEPPPLRWERQGRYIVYEDSTVTDSRTQLMWMRCPYGQLYDFRWRTCTGRAERMAWEEATAVARDRVHGHSDWRLPTRAELLSLTERQRGRPPIDLRVFPGTPSGPFWTGTPFQARSELVWYVYFDHGGVPAYGERDYPRYVRLVRDAPPLPD